MSSHQAEWTESGPLLTADGRLARPGWCRRPIHEYRRDQIGAHHSQRREWEYYAIFSRDRFVNITVADLDFGAFAHVDILDLTNGRKDFAMTVTRDAGRVTMPSGFAGGAIFAGDDGPILAVDRDDRGHRIRVNLPRNLVSRPIAGELRLRPRPRGAETFVCAFPFAGDDRRFFLEDKNPNLSADGWLLAGDRRHEFDPERDVAVMDWGRGVWPNRVNWRWGAGAGAVDGVPISFNLGNGFGDTGAASENVLFVDGVAHKLDRVDWTFDPRRLSRPWRLRSPDGRFNLVLKPLRAMPVNANVLIKRIRVNKAFGLLSGSVCLTDGTRLRVDGLPGFAEDVHIKW